MTDGIVWRLHDRNSRNYFSSATSTRAHSYFPRSGPVMCAHDCDMICDRTDRWRVVPQRVGGSRTAGRIDSLICDADVVAFTGFRLFLGFHFHCYWTLEITVNVAWKQYITLHSVRVCLCILISAKHLEYTRLSMLLSSITYRLFL